MTEMMGSSVHLHVNAMGGTAILVVQSMGLTRKFDIGQTVAFTFDGDVAHVFSKETERNLEF